MDERARKIERRVAAGEQSEAPRLLLARLRAGELTREALELAAYAGDPDAAALVTPPEPDQPGEIHWLYGFDRWDQHARAVVCRAIAEAAQEHSPARLCGCGHIAALHVEPFGGCVHCECLAPALEPLPPDAFATLDLWALDPTHQSTAVRARVAADTAEPAAACAHFAAIGFPDFDWIGATRAASPFVPEDDLRAAVRRLLTAWVRSGAGVAQAEKPVLRCSFEDYRLPMHLNPEAVDTDALSRACDRVAGTDGISRFGPNNFLIDLAPGHSALVLEKLLVEEPQRPFVRRGEDGVYLVAWLQGGRQTVFARFDPERTQVDTVSAHLLMLDVALDHYDQALRVRHGCELIHETVYEEGLGERPPGAIDDLLEGLDGPGDLEPSEL